MIDDRRLVLHQNKVGQFVNPWDSWRDQRVKAAFYLLTNKPAKDIWPSSKDPQLDVNLPILKPNFGQPFSSSAAGIRLTWLGHASVLFHIDGVNILCDPIFSDRCGFVGPKRYRPVPCKIDDLPMIDAVVISHNHFDHLDLPTMRKIARKFPDPTWCVPKGCADLISSYLRTDLNEKLPRIWEAVWWDERIVGSTGVRLIFTPTQHWSGRNLFTDLNRSLWGSWAFVGPQHRAWFGGDTGYCVGFKEIGERYGPLDVAAIPIGAYTPRELLRSQHVNPYDAVQIHLDIQARHSIGIHWGTFYIGRERYLQPKEDLKAAVEAAGLSQDDFRTMHHGQSLCYRREPDELVLVE